MNKSQRPQPKRRLAIEHIESRLMLSGDGLQSLDTNTFNLDPIASDYAVIPIESIDAPLLIYPIGTSASDSTPILSAAERTNRLNDVLSYIRDVAQLSNTVGVAGASTTWNSIHELHVARLASPLSSASNFTTFDEPSNLDSRFQLIYGVAEGFMATLQLGPPSVLSTTGSVYLDIAGPEPIVGLSSSSNNVPLDLAIADGPMDAISEIRDGRVTVPIEPIRPNNSAPSLVINPAAPGNSIITIGHSDAQVNVGQVIDELLSTDVGIVDQALPSDIATTGSEGSVLVSAGGVPQNENLVIAPSGDETTLVADADASIDEGGMIPIQDVVDAIAEEAAQAPGAEQIAADGVPGGIAGELSRVAVMELITGEADPAAQRSVVDQTFLVAADNTSFVPERIVVPEVEPAGAAVAAVRAMVEQGALAASLVAPANPVYLAAMLSTAGDAFAAATMSAPLSAAQLDAGQNPDARGEAFSQWHEAPQTRFATDEESGESSGLLPLIGALALERVVATKRKRKQNAAAAPPLPVR